MHQIAASLIMGLVLGGPSLMLIILISLAIVTARFRHSLRPAAA